VESSLLRSVGYDPVTEVLELELRNGRIYQYFGIDELIYHELIASPSRGRYFNESIKDAYPYRRVK
jgi:hypothetical protein